MRYMLNIISLFVTVCVIGCGSSDSTTASSTSVSQPPQQESLKSIVDKIVKQSNTAGVTLYVGTTNESWSIASGAVKWHGEAIQTDDSLRIASMTKLIVATGLLLLQQEGKVNLDDYITNYIKPSLINKIENYQTITVRQLLAMTSGIPDYSDQDAFIDVIDQDTNRIWQYEEAISYVYNVPQSFEPGTNWEYSNTNYVLIDAIVEGATGFTLAQELRRLIFTPLLMQSTYMEFRESSAENGTKLSTHGYDGEENVTQINDAIGFGDGGLVSTNEDLGAFMQALFAERWLLSEASLSEMMSFHSTEHYGLGIEQLSTSHGIALGHDGSSSGFSGEMYYFPEKEITLVILTNHMDSDAIENIKMQTLTYINNH